MTKTQDNSVTENETELSLLSDEIIIQPNCSGQKFISKKEDFKKQVETMAGMGLLTQKDIATILGVSEDFLVANYRKELDLGRPKMAARIGKTFYSKVMEGDTACLIFWLKTQAKWKETIQHEGVPGGEPIQVQFFLPQNGRDDGT